MPQTESIRLQDHFAELADPRRREVTYPLVNIVVIAVCAVICGADDFVAIARFGNTKRDWSRSFWISLSAFLRTTAWALCWPPSNRPSSRSVYSVGSPGLGPSFGY